MYFDSPYTNVNENHDLTADWANYMLGCMEVL